MTIALIAAAAAVVLYYLLFVAALRRPGRERVFEVAEQLPGSAGAGQQDDSGLLRRWLFLAGYRSAGAPATFVSLCLLAFFAGLLATFLISRSGLQATAIRGMSRVPGVAGEIFLPFIYVGPWIILALIASLPVVVVRKARRQRVAQIEEDMPVTLELLATLSEAGLGFDAALERIVSAEPADRPLASELRIFQLEVLTGRRRVHCLRRLARRVDVTAFTVFVSALAQAEQIGAGVASVLRRQADDLRDRRREDAIAKAMTLPVKLLFPLVICFLPGIFVVTLGPVFHQFFQFAEGLIRQRGGAP